MACLSVKACNFVPRKVYMQSEYVYVVSTKHILTFKLNAITHLALYVFYMDVCLLLEFNVSLSQ